MLAQAQYTFSATVSAGPDAGQTISGTLMLKTEQEDDGTEVEGSAGADHRGGDDHHHERGDRRPGALRAQLKTKLADCAAPTAPMQVLLDTPRPP